MKAIITVKRITEYSSIVEMDEDTFNRLNQELEEGGNETIRRTERELNKLVDVEDWQDDEFESLEEFKRFEE